MTVRSSHVLKLCSVIVVVCGLASTAVRGALDLGPEQIVQAGGSDIDVPGYSVPSFVDWNADGKSDLVVGEGSGIYPGKVRVYLNTGSPQQPQFDGFFHAQSGGADLTLTGSGCMGCFPRVVDWNADQKIDLLVGHSYGQALVFLNVATAAEPAFDGGTYLQVGPAGGKVNIDVGSRATAIPVDWNGDARDDLVVGALDGRIHVFINQGTDGPDFLAETFAPGPAGDLVVYGGRSSPVFMDLDDDGLKDLLTGNTNGQLLLYSNTGSNESPSFGGYTAVEADGVPILLPNSPRSRPFVCDWTGDGLTDVLIGAADGKVHLYQGVPEPAGAVLLALLALGLPKRGGLAALRRRRA